MEIIIALITSVIGGSLVAIVNHILTRRKTEAEIDKLKAETKKILAEAEKLSGDTKQALHILGEVSYYDLPKLSEIVLYDSAEGFRSYDLESRFSDHVIQQGVLIIEQEEAVIRLQTYVNKGIESTFIHKNDIISGYRRFHASCEMRVINACYEVSVCILEIEEGDGVDDRYIEVTEIEWTKTDYYFRSPADWNFRFNILVHRSSGDGSLQIRNLVIAERLS